MNTLSPPESLEFVAGDAAWEKYRELALTDLFWFASYVLGYGERVPIREHAHRACRFVERRTGHPALDTARYRKIMMPRETGKTTILTQSYVIQRLCGNPDLSILIANEKEQNAKDFLYAIKQQIESNKVLRALFPEVLPPDLNDTVWSASRIILNRKSARKEPSIFVIGVGGTVTGTHPDIIIVDDMISREAAENARAGSWQIMHGVSRWVNQLDMLLNKNYEHAEITFVGTRWYFDDVYDHLDKAFGYGEAPTVFNLRTKLPNGEIQIIPAQRLGDLAVFTRSGIENGRPAFPEIWSAERMAQSRIRDEVLFAANILNNPSDELTATFKVEWLQYYDWLDEQRIVYTDGAGAKKVLGIRDLDVLFFVDPGGFGVRQLEDRARAAIVVVGSDGTGSHNVLDVYAERDTFLACIQQIVAWVTRYQPRKLVIERVGQQAAFIQLVREHLTRAGLSVTIDEEPPGRMNKDIRILGLEPYFQRGEIRIGKGPNFHGFRTQYTQFPRTAQKDILDALAYLPRHLRRMPGSTFRSTTQRQQFELAAYRTRRGLAV